MITKEAVINNQVGLHARPATFFIQKANEFWLPSSIPIFLSNSHTNENRDVHCTSLLFIEEEGTESP